MREAVFVETPVAVRQEPLYFSCSVILQVQESAVRLKLAWAATVAEVLLVRFALIEAVVTAALTTLI